MDPTLLPFLGVLIGAFATYLIQVRRTRGNIKTTEAADLWTASEKLRDWTQIQMDSQDKKIQRLEDRIDGLFKENGALTAQVVALKQENVAHENTIRVLTDKLEIAHARIAQLETRTNGL